MKKLSICGLWLGLLLALGCNNSNPDSVKEAQKENNANADSMQKKQSVTDSSTAVASKEDADFMVKAASGGMLEVELGKLALSHAARQGVKDFGVMMMHDHGTGGDEIRSLAAGKRIVLPDSVSNDQKKEWDNLMKKKGLDFDRSYISLMVDDHKEDISEFEKAAKEANDPDIRAFAQNHLAMLKLHLDSAQSLDKKIGRKISAPQKAPPY